jgi:hypothetical protein
MTSEYGRRTGDIGSGAIVIQGDDNIVVTPSRRPPPRQLPPDVSQFTGREEELGWLREYSQPALDGVSSRLLCIAGLPGSGKSALALHFAHRLAAETRSDVQLYSVLRRSDHGPVAATTILKGFLEAFGVDRPEGDEFSLSARFRSEIADRKAIVLLDDALSSAQVRPLLPAGPHCLTVVTSRRLLGGLDGAEHLSLHEFESPQAEELIQRIAGDQLTAEPGELAQLARLCGHLPLALRIAAANLRRRGWPVRKMIRRLSDERKRLAELRIEDLAVMPSFSLSYEQLDAAEQRLFRRIFGYSVVSVELAAALIAADEEIEEVEARRKEENLLVHAEAERLVAAWRSDSEQRASDPVAAERGGQHDLSQSDEFTIRLPPSLVQLYRKRDWLMEKAVTQARMNLGFDPGPAYLDCEEAEELLGRLVEEQLAQPDIGDSYRFHDLLRVFAHDLFARDDEASPADIGERENFGLPMPYVKRANEFRAAVERAGGGSPSPAEVARRYLQANETTDYLTALRKDVGDSH